MDFYDISGNLVTLGSGGSPIADKKVLFIGDSNLYNMSSALTSYMNNTYGCVTTVRATGGMKWETANGRTTIDDSAVGRVNTLIADIATGNYISEFDYIILMFGTNSGTTGNVTDTDADVSTMSGAMKYCLKQLCYYGRKIKIGIVIPIRWIGEEGYEATDYPSKFEKVRTIARMYSIPILDMWFESRVIQNNQMTLTGESIRDAGYLTVDQVHMAENGKNQFMHRIGKWVAYEL